jgi:FtsP/CotA-like multicopper oxidase with cupredoxin domain
LRDANESRRDFLKLTGTAACAAACGNGLCGTTAEHFLRHFAKDSPDYILRIAASALEITPKPIISTITYNDQFPGPLLRFKEGQPVAVEAHNDTDTPQQLHWHGQFVSTGLDGAAEEGTPLIPARGMRRIEFTPRPAGLRFYHTHNRARTNLYAGQYTGQVGAVYIEPQREQGDYDREVCLLLKEFEPIFSRGGDMAQDFPAPTAKIKELESAGESAMKASLAKGMPHGYEVGYRYFTIHGRMLGHGEPVKVKQGERVLFHVLNGSATEIRSLALPGHGFRVVARDGNLVPTPAEVPGLVAGNCGADLGDRGNESSRGLDTGRSGG